MSMSESHHEPSGTTKPPADRRPDVGREQAGHDLRYDQQTPCAECEQPIGWWVGHLAVCTPCLERINRERYAIGDRPLSP